MIVVVMPRRRSEVIVDIRSGVKPGSAARAARNSPAPASIRIQAGSAAKVAEDRAREVGLSPSPGPVGIRLRADTGAKFERAIPHKDGVEARPAARAASMDPDVKDKAAIAQAKLNDRIPITADPGNEPAGLTPGGIKRLFRRWFGR
jgi:hypothetical protein